MTMLRVNRRRQLLLPTVRHTFQVVALVCSVRRCVSSSLRFLLLEDFLRSSHALRLSPSPRPFYFKRSGSGGALDAATSLPHFWSRRRAGGERPRAAAEASAIGHVIATPVSLCPSALFRARPISPGPSSQRHGHAQRSALAALCCSPAAELSL